MFFGMKAEIGWQDAAGRRWAELQERTDAQLDPLGRAVLECVRPRPGERALDVGCGAGQSTLELAELVGPPGSVVGVDVSEPLLERAKERVKTAGIANIELVLANAATFSSAAPFDLIFSRFGVMFFEQPVAAFAHLRALLVAGGRLGFVCWQALELNPWAHAPLAAVQRLRPEHPLVELLQPGKPGPFALSDAALVERILGQAGFGDVSVVPSEVEVALGGARTLAEAVDYALQIGPAARFIADAGLASDPRVRDSLGTALAPYATERGIFVPARTLVVTATRDSIHSAHRRD
jgi:SAM-dependent methyltransferase